MIPSVKLNTIMDYTPAHTEKLVRIINFAYRLEEYHDSIIDMVKIIRNRYYATNTDGNKDYCDGVYNNEIVKDTLMYICDDTDLENIIKYIRWEEKNHPMIYKCKDALRKVYLKRGAKTTILMQLEYVAQFLNGNWKPDFSNPSQIKYAIVLDMHNTIEITSITFNFNVPCFKDIETAQRAIEVLGKKNIIAAFQSKMNF